MSCQQREIQPTDGCSRMLSSTDALQALHNDAFRETYAAVLDEARVCVKAVLKSAEYKSAVYEQAAALGQLVMERNALLRG